MARKGQASQDFQDLKFSPSRPCQLCGKPTCSLAMKCQRCLTASYLADELAFTRVWLQGHRGQPIQLGRDPHKVRHLVLLRLKNLGWCGVKVTERARTRLAFPLGMFPPAICAECLGIYEGMAL